MTKQPSWWCVANIGDADPYEHGGAFVLVDRRGVYAPELILIESFDDSSSRRLSNIVLDRLTVIKDRGTKLSNDPVDRALGYKALADYHGVINFDQYPKTLTEEKARLMCDRFLKQIEESESWHNGYFGD